MRRSRANRSTTERRPNRSCPTIRGSCRGAAPLRPSPPKCIQVIGSLASLPHLLFISHQSLLCLCRGFPLGRAVPLEGARQSFLKAHLGLIAKILPRLSTVRLGIPDVSIARRIVLGFQSLAGNFSKRANHFIEGDASAHADVKNFSADIRRFAGE